MKKHIKRYFQRYIKRYIISSNHLFVLCIFPLPHSKQSKAVGQVTTIVICTNILRLVRMMQQKYTTKKL
jgi:hypothetical protein